MNQEQYRSLLSWAQARGLEINPNIERKQVDGIWGMYATDTIPVQSFFISFPIENLIQIDPSFVYPADVDDNTKYLHRIAVELSKGVDSEFAEVFFAFESLDSFRGVSCYFFDDADLQQVQRMNPILCQKILEFNNQVAQHIHRILALDDSLTHDTVLMIILNSCSRCWGTFGFLPIFDLFNHHDLVGARLKLLEGRDRIGFGAKMTYQAGEQIWVAYDRHDMYTYAISYNFFDPTDYHFIDVPYRLIKTATSDFDKQVLKHLAQRYPVATQEANGVIHFQVKAKQLMLQEMGPSSLLIDYVKQSGFQTPDELKAGVCSIQSFDKTMFEMIEVLHQNNRVDEVDLKSLPEKLHRFYHLLQKEKQILMNNKKWVVGNSMNQIICADMHRFLT